MFDQLLNSDKILVAQIAPAVRVSLAEEFGADPGTETTGQIITALKKLGFKYVFDTSFGADIVALEEANELKHRIENNGPFPMFTSCCIGWKLYALRFDLEKLEKFSTAMAPQITLGALAKTYFAEQAGVDKDKIQVISIMPCVSKKKEAQMHAKVGFHEVNLVLTTREIAQILKDKDINPLKLENSEFDQFLGEASRGGRKFGTTGGVAEAVINSLYDMYGEKKTVTIEDDDEIGHYTFNIAGKEINVVRIYGLQNYVKFVKELDDKSKTDKVYHLVEVMACPYGCVGGPGQPLPISMDKNKQRSHALRRYANKQKYSDPYANPEVQRVYDKYLMKFGSCKAKALLHIGCEICKLTFDEMEGE